MQLQPIFLFIGNLGGWEFVLIFAVILLLFGAKKLPELARGLGKGLREFKDATTQVSNDIASEVNKKEEYDHNKVKPTNNIVKEKPAV
jgi:sec-independent protein translocase protein TatA